jgi:hypothetical protein
MLLKIFVKRFEVVSISEKGLFVVFLVIVFFLEDWETVLKQSKEKHHFIEIFLAFFIVIIIVYFLFDGCINFFLIRSTNYSLIFIKKFIKK